jgi:uncharacterized protein (TIGR02118 family)
MIKFTVAVTRRFGMSKADFDTHYRNRHGPLCASVPTFWRHVHRYLQNSSVTSDAFRCVSGYSPDRDCVSQLWFASLDIFHQAFAEPEYLSLIRPDEISFVDMPSLIPGLGVEKTLFGPDSPGSPHKVVVFRKRRPEISRSDLQAFWHDTYGPAVVRHELARKSLRRYVQTHFLDVALEIPGLESYDLLDEFWCSTLDGAADFLLGLHKAAPAASEKQRLSDDSQDIVMFVREREVASP